MLRTKTKIISLLQVALSLVAVLGLCFAGTPEYQYMDADAIRRVEFERLMAFVVYVLGYGFMLVVLELLKPQADAESAARWHAEQAQQLAQSAAETEAEWQAELAAARRK